MRVIVEAHVTDATARKRGLGMPVPVKGLASTHHGATGKLD
jgi:hypothetical protein